MENSLDLKLFTKECKFLLGVVSEATIPVSNLPEVAFIGRSNVGKSSLINKIVNNRNTARTSNTPGRTQQLNFFSLDDTLMIVDLPGYGYAKAPLKKVDSWNKLIKNYLIGRKNLKRTFLLIDSRHGVKKNDLDFMKMLDDSAVAYQFIFTKTDLVSGVHLKNVISHAETLFLNHTALTQNILTTSSKKGVGITEIHQEILELI